MEQSKPPPTIRIRENATGDGWIIEQSGETIPAPFPLTEAAGKSQDYERICSRHWERFRAMLSRQEKEFSASLVALARRIAIISDCIPGSGDGWK